MLAINNKQKIFLAINPIDFRCGIDGIAVTLRRGRVTALGYSAKLGPATDQKMRN